MTSGCDIPPPHTLQEQSPEDGNMRAISVHKWDILGQPRCVTPMSPDPHRIDSSTPAVLCWWRAATPDLTWQNLLPLLSSAVTHPSHPHQLSQEAAEKNWAGMRGQHSMAFPAPPQRKLDKKVRIHVESPGQCFQLLLMHREIQAAHGLTFAASQAVHSVYCFPPAKSGQGHTSYPFH